MSETCEDICDEWHWFLSVHHRVVLHHSDRHRNIPLKNQSSAVAGGQPSHHLQPGIPQESQRGASPRRFSNKSALGFPIKQRGCHPEDKAIVQLSEDPVDIPLVVF